MRHRRTAAVGQSFLSTRGDMSFVMQAVLWVAVIAIIGALVYVLIVKGGSGPLPGENLFSP